MTNQVLSVGSSRSVKNTHLMIITGRTVLFYWDSLEACNYKKKKHKNIKACKKSV